MGMGFFPKVQRKPNGREKFLELLNPLTNQGYNIFFVGRVFKIGIYLKYPSGKENF